MFGRRKNELEQEGGAGSTNYQAAGNMEITGWSPQQVTNIVSEAIQANALEMRAIAADVFNTRIEHFSSMVVDRLAVEPQELTTATSEPDVQYSIIQAGIGYARTGDEDMAEILVDLIADRAKEETRSLIASVVSDAIAIAPRLTDGEIAILTIYWRLVRTVNWSVTDLDSFAEFVRQEFVPLIPFLPKGGTSCYHLQALGCVSVLLDTDFHKPWLSTYAGFFTDGFDLEDISAELRETAQALPDGEKPFIAALRNPAKFQVRSFNAILLEKSLASRVPPEQLEELKQLLARTMSPEQVVEVLSEIDPRMRDLAEIWATTDIKSLTLTPVGIAIAHANWKHMTGSTTPLSVWVNEGPSLT